MDGECFIIHINTTHFVPCVLLHGILLITIFLCVSLSHRVPSYADAACLYEQALAMRLAVLPTLGCPSEPHPEVEMSKLWLGHIYIHLSRFSEAKPLITQAGKALCTLLGNEHEAVSQGLHFLARLLSCLGKYAFAKKLFDRSVEGLTLLLGPAHPAVAEVLTSFADCLRIPGESVS